MPYLKKRAIVSYLGGKATKIIIEGITENGETFRPSDWAERLCGRLASFDPDRMRYYYSPNLYPEFDHDTQVKCLIIDPILKVTHPEIYDAVLKFAYEHKLKVYEEE